MIALNLLRRVPQLLLGSSQWLRGFLLKSHALRWALGGIGAIGATAYAAFFVSAFGLQNDACSLKGLPNFLSDHCGSIGAGGKPAREERLAWEALPKNSCEAQSAHRLRFPDGAYVDEIARRWTTRHPERDTRETPAKHTRRRYLQQGETAFPTRAAAAADAEARAAPDARDYTCVQFNEAGERFSAVRIVRFDPKCRESADGGHYCGGEYTAVCTMLAYRLHDVCD